MLLENLEMKKTVKEKELLNYFGVCVSFSSEHFFHALKLLCNSPSYRTHSL
jgi:hypothetical protein